MYHQGKEERKIYSSNSIGRITPSKILFASLLFYPCKAAVKMWYLLQAQRNLKWVSGGTYVLAFDLSHLTRLYVTVGNNYLALISTGPSRIAFGDLSPPHLEGVLSARFDIGSQYP
jgi:hypothetical protein